MPALFVCHGMIAAEAAPTAGEADPEMFDQGFLKRPRERLQRTRMGHTIARRTHEKVLIL